VSIVTIFQKIELYTGIYLRRVYWARNSSKNPNCDYWRSWQLALPQSSKPLSC